MKKAFVSSSGVMILIIFVVCGCQSGNSHKTHWEYSGAAGPEQWGKLDEKFAVCSTGKSQSPVNLTGFVKSNLKPITFNYKTSATEILNNGHTVQVNYSAGSSIDVNGVTFELKQFHFHAPGENHIESKSFPMEAHLVHADLSGNLAVIALMFKEGEANKLIESLWKNMPAKAENKYTLSGDLNAMGLIPKNRSYYSFDGSLTTPPCTEGVKWMVIKEPVPVSAAQVKAFVDVMGHPTNRPVQPLNERKVLQ